MEFFGYLCRQGSYRLTDDRKKEVTDILFPSGNGRLKRLQQFLGSAVYFKPFIYHYSDKTAALTEMTAKNFNWDPKTWTKDYVAIFESFKLDILNSFTLYHPDYDLPWFLSVDASDVACGGVLIQVTTQNQQQVISFVSKKFTTSATRWTTIEKEAFGMFYSCMKLKYYLYAKEFVMLTDHNNLLWMEKSEVPKIARMRIYLQEFNFRLVHIPGKSNVFADWCSRRYNDDELSTDESHKVLQVMDDAKVEVRSDPVGSTIQSVHNPRMGHHGAMKTWILLNKYHPGHSIPMRLVQDFVRECSYCQKIRDTVNESLKAPVRAIIADHPRHLCAYDLLSITPLANDYGLIHVFKTIPGRLVFLY